MINIEKYIAIIGMLLAFTCLIFGASILRNNERTKNNEALIYNMSKEVQVNTAKITTFLEDASVAESWANSIYNLDNQPFVLECAFVFQVPFDSVTQDMFNQRYLLNNHVP